MTTLYTTTLETVLENTTAYKGRADVTYTPSLVPEEILTVPTLTTQKILENGLYTPVANTTASKKVLRVPRHGENVASPVYVPPVMLVQNYDTVLPTLPVTTMSPNMLSKGHAVGGTNPFCVLSYEDFLFNAASTIGDVSITEMLDNVFKLQHPIATPSSYNTGVVTLQNGVFVIDDTFTNATLTIGGTGNTFVVINAAGNITIKDIRATTVNDKTVLIVFGNGANIIFQNPWHPGDLGMKNIICSGNVTAPGVVSGATVNYVIVGTATINGVGAGTSKYYNGTSTVPYVYNPNPYTSLNAFAMFFYPPGAYADLHLFDLVFDVTYGTDPPTTSAFTGGVVFYNMSPYTNTLNMTSVVTNVMSRLAVHYRVVPNGVIEGSCYFIIKTLYDGMEFSTYFVFQKTATHVPNFGVHTEPYGFSDYMVSDMMQTYRIDNDVYAPFSAGKYMKLNTVGFVQLSTSNWILTTPITNDKPLDHYINTMHITSHSTMSLSTGIVTAPPSEEPWHTLGGMDSYVSSGDNFVSKYRVITPISDPPNELHEEVTVYMPTKSNTRYAPYNGKVNNTHGFVDLFNGTSENIQRRSGYQTMVLDCIQSRVAGETIEVFANSTGQVSTNNVFVTYKDPNLVHFVFDKNFYWLHNGDEKNIDGVLYKYSYASNTNTATFIKIDCGITSIIGSWTFSVVVDVHVTLYLKVIFGDTIMNDTLFVEDAEIFNVKNHIQVEVHGPVVAKGFGPMLESTMMYLPGLSSSTKNDFIRRGIIPVNGFEDTWIDTVSRSEFLLYPEVVIPGRVQLKYIEGEDSVFIPLIPGNYMNYMSNLITVDSTQHVPISSLPLMYSNIIYTALLITSVMPAAKHFTIGVGGDYETLSDAASALNLWKLQRLETVGVTLLHKIVSGSSEFDIQGGSGHIRFLGGDGGHIVINIP